MPDKEPLIPAHVDLRDFPFMPLDVARLRDSSIVDDVDGEEFRAAILLWCAAWHQVPAGSLPDEPRQLAKFAGYGRVISEWEKVATGAMHGWVKCSDGRWYHPVVCEKALEAWEKKSEFTERSNTRAAQAKAAAEARWGKKGSGEGESGSGEGDQAQDAPNANASNEQCGRMPDALPKGNRQGQGIDRDRDNAAVAATGPGVGRSSASPKRGTDEFGPWLRSLVGTEPVGADPNTKPILDLLDEGLTREDIGAGIGAAMADPSFRLKSWKSLVGWVRVAAKERLSASPKSPRTARDPDAPTPLPDLVEYRSVVIRRCADHFRGKWRDVWPNAHRPDHPDCTLPEEIIDEARAIIAAEEAAMAEPGGLARLHGYVPDSPRRPIQPVH